MKSFFSRLFRVLIIIGVVGSVILTFSNWIIVPLLGCKLLSWKVCFATATVITGWLDLKYSYIIDTYKVWKTILWAGATVLVLLLLK